MMQESATSGNEKMAGGKWHLKLPEMADCESGWSFLYVC